MPTTSAAIAALAALALVACSKDAPRSPAGSAMPHGATPLPPHCPEANPDRLGCRVPR